MQYCRSGRCTNSSNSIVHRFVVSLVLLRRGLQRGPSRVGAEFDVLQSGRAMFIPSTDALISRQGSSRPFEIHARATATAGFRDARLSLARAASV